MSTPLVSRYVAALDGLGLDCAAEGDVIRVPLGGLGLTVVPDQDDPGYLSILCGLSAPQDLSLPALARAVNEANQTCPVALFLIPCPEQGVLLQVQGLVAGGHQLPTTEFLLDVLPSYLAAVEFAVQQWIEILTFYSVLGDLAEDAALTQDQS